MQMLKRAVYLCAALALSACGGQESDAQNPSTEPATQTAELTGGSSQGCAFNIFTFQRPGTTPPIWDVRLNRAASTTCPWGQASLLLGSSTNFMPKLSLAANDLGVAVGYIYKTSTSGSAPSMLSLQHVDPATMTVVRSTGIAPFLGSGYIYSGELAIATDGTTLTVTGTKSGTISGATGTGSNYTATYPDFFTSTTAPTIVLN